MNKIIMLVFLAHILLLSFCSEGGGTGTVMIFDDSRSKADARFEQMLEIIADKDSSAMTEMFSSKALGEANDFEDSMEYLFDFFVGNVTSWKQDSSTTKTSIEYGKKSVMHVTWYTVETDVDKYMFFVIDYSENTFDPDNAGLYTLRVIKAKEKATQFTYWQDMQIAGIYKPE